MVKNGPLQAGMIRQSRGSDASGNAKAVSKLNTYRASTAPVTGRTASTAPAPIPKPGNQPAMTGKKLPAQATSNKPGLGKPPC